MNLYELNDIVFNCLDYERSDEAEFLNFKTLKQLSVVLEKSVEKGVSLRLFWNDSIELSSSPN